MKTALTFMAAENGFGKNGENWWNDQFIGNKWERLFASDSEREAIRPTLFWAKIVLDGYVAADGCV